MKKTKLKAAVLTLLIITSLNAQAYQNEPDGFRGIKWGTALQENEAEMSLVESGKTTNYYQRKDDKMEIGAASLERLAYGYTGNQLSTVIISTEGYDNQQALIETLKAQFGRGYKPNRYMDTYLWQGPTTTIYLNCKSVRSSCSLIFSSKEMKDKEDAQRKAQAESAASDF